MPSKNLQKVNDRYLESMGIDPHQIKKELVGDSGIARYDLYEDKDTGLLWLFGKGGRGEGIYTGISIR